MESALGNDALGRSLLDSLGEQLVQTINKSLAESAEVTVSATSDKPLLSCPETTVNVPIEKEAKKSLARSFKTFVAACRTNTATDVPDPCRPPNAKYTVTMYNMSRGTTKTKVMSFWKVPVKVEDIMDKLENEYNIPQSFQRIRFRGRSLEAEQTIKEIKLSSGDHFEVSSSVASVCASVVYSVTYMYCFFVV